MTTAADTITTWLRETVDLLDREQSAPLGGDARGLSCLTITGRTGISYRSLGAKGGDSEFTTYWFPAQPLEMKPVRLDLSLWPFLDGLSELTGNPRYSERVTAMADAFAEHGFDPLTHLGYFGESTDFDVVRLGPISSKPGTAPHFKPGNSGACPGMPLKRLWRHASTQMERSFHAMFLGLITDPARMDYNRFCCYDFDASRGKHAMAPDARHCAFDSAGARMIHWWASCFAHTGDHQCLDWAQRMADKWAAVQHPQSGLVPNFFGAAGEYAAVQSPGQWAEARGAAMTAMALVEAAEQLEQRLNGRALAGQVTRMAVALARGVARFSYDPDRRLFREVLRLDGRPYEQTARYTFRTQAEKDEAVRRNPLYEQVAVFEGIGFYRHPPYWSECAGSDLPYQLAFVAERTGDAQLRDDVAAMVEPIMDEVRRLKGPMTPEKRWTFYGSARYIQTLVLLAQMSGDVRYLRDAQTVAEREIGQLVQDGAEPWWRRRDRNILLDALLMLAETQGSNAA